MIISELQALLEEIKNKHGDVEVKMHYSPYTPHGERQLVKRDITVVQDTNTHKYVTIWG